MSHVYVGYACLASIARLIIKVCSTFRDVCAICKGAYASSLYTVSRTHMFSTIHSWFTSPRLSARLNSGALCQSVAWLLTFLGLALSRSTVGTDVSISGSEDSWVVVFLNNCPPYVFSPKVSSEVQMLLHSPAVETFCVYYLGIPLLACTWFCIHHTVRVCCHGTYWHFSETSNFSVHISSMKSIIWSAEFFQSVRTNHTETNRLSWCTDTRLRQTHANIKL